MKQYSVFDSTGKMINSRHTTSPFNHERIPTSGYSTSGVTVSAYREATATTPAIIITPSTPKYRPAKVSAGRIPLAGRIPPSSRIPPAGKIPPAGRILPAGKIPHAGRIPPASATWKRDVHQIQKSSSSVDNHVVGGPTLNNITPTTGETSHVIIGVKSITGDSITHTGKNTDVVDKSSMITTSKPEQIHQECHSKKETDIVGEINEKYTMYSEGKLREIDPKSVGKVSEHENQTAAEPRTKNNDRVDDRTEQEKSKSISQSGAVLPSPLSSVCSKIAHQHKTVTKCAIIAENPQIAHQPETVTKCATIAANPQIEHQPETATKCAILAANPEIAHQPETSTMCAVLAANPQPTAELPEPDITTKTKSDSNNKDVLKENINGANSASTNRTTTLTLTTTSDLSLLEYKGEITESIREDNYVECVDFPGSKRDVNLFREQGLKGNNSEILNFKAHDDSSNHERKSDTEKEVFEDYSSITEPDDEFPLDSHYTTIPGCSDNFVSRDPVLAESDGTRYEAAKVEVQTHYSQKNLELDTSNEDIYAIPIPKSLRRKAASLQNKNPPYEPDSGKSHLLDEIPPLKPPRSPNDTSPKFTLENIDTNNSSVTNTPEVTTHIESSHVTETQHVSTDDYDYSNIPKHGRYDFFSLRRQPKILRTVSSSGKMRTPVNLEMMLRCRRQSLVDIPSSTSAEESLSVEDILKSCSEFEDSNAYYRKRTSSDSTQNSSWYSMSVIETLKTHETSNLHSASNSNQISNLRSQIHKLEEMDNKQGQLPRPPMFTSILKKSNNGRLVNRSILKTTKYQETCIVFQAKKINVVDEEGQSERDRARSDNVHGRRVDAPRDISVTSSDVGLNYQPDFEWAKQEPMIRSPKVTFVGQDDLDLTNEKPLLKSSKVTFIGQDDLELANQKPGVMMSQKLSNEQINLNCEKDVSGDIEFSDRHCNNKCDKSLQNSYCKLEVADNLPSSSDGPKIQSDPVTQNSDYDNLQNAENTFQSSGKISTLLPKEDTGSREYGGVMSLNDSPDTAVIQSKFVDYQSNHFGVRSGWKMPPDRLAFPTSTKFQQKDGSTERMSLGTRHTSLQQRDGSTERMSMGTRNTSLQQNDCVTERLYLGTRHTSLSQKDGGTERLFLETRNTSLPQRLAYGTPISPEAKADLSGVLLSSTFDSLSTYSSYDLRSPVTSSSYAPDSLSPTSVFSDSADDSSPGVSPLYVDVFTDGDVQYPQQQSPAYYAKLEATEAIKWLRAAGFPQYAQMFVERQFPVDLLVIEKDHDFLDRDSLKSLFRRLQTLNKYAGSSLDIVQDKKVPCDDDDDEYLCALSDRWEYHKSTKRWSRKNATSPSEHHSTMGSDLNVKSPRSCSHDSLLDHDHESQSEEPSPITEPKRFHLFGLRQKDAKPPLSSQKKPVSLQSGDYQTVSSQFGDYQKVSSQFGDYAVPFSSQKGDYKSVSSQEGDYKTVSSPEGDYTTVYSPEGDYKTVSSPEGDYKTVSSPQGEYYKTVSLLQDDYKTQVSSQKSTPEIKKQPLSTETTLGGSLDKAPASTSPLQSTSPKHKTKPSKTLLQKIEGLKPKKLRRQSKRPNIKEISFPIVEDSEYMRARLERMNCVDISPKSESVSSPTFINKNHHHRSSIDINERYTALNIAPNQIQPRSRMSLTSSRSQSDLMSRSVSTSSPSSSGLTSNNLHQSSFNFTTNQKTLNGYETRPLTTTPTQATSPTNFGPSPKNYSSPNLHKINMENSPQIPAHWETEGHFPLVLHNGYAEVLGRPVSKTLVANVEHPDMRVTPNGKLESALTSPSPNTNLSHRKSIYDNIPSPAISKEERMIFPGIYELKDRENETRIKPENEDLTQSNARGSFEGRKHIFSRDINSELNQQGGAHTSRNDSPMRKSFQQMHLSVRDRSVSCENSLSSQSPKESFQHSEAETSSIDSQTNTTTGSDLFPSKLKGVSLTSSPLGTPQDLTLGREAEMSSIDSRNSARTDSEQPPSKPRGIVHSESADSYFRGENNNTNNNNNNDDVVFENDNNKGSHRTSLKKEYEDLDTILEQLYLNIDELTSYMSKEQPASRCASQRTSTYRNSGIAHLEAETSLSGGEGSVTAESSSEDPEFGLTDVSRDDSLDRISEVSLRRADSNGEQQLSKTPSERQRKKIRWHSFQKSHRPAINSREMQINGLSVCQMVRLQKLSLLRLTVIMEKCLPISKSGWHWMMPRFLKKQKISDFTNKKVFGVPFSVMTNRTGQPLPQCVLYAMRYLRRNCASAVGIFRKSGVKSKIQQLCDDLENNPDGVDFEGMSAYNVADMLKTYFRDLPECLLTNKMSDVFRSIYMHVPEGQRLEAIQTAIVLLPDENREVLQSVLLFLSDITVHEREHQMNASNLAVCFTPTVFQLGPQQVGPHSPKRSYKSPTAIADPREIVEQKAAHECLLMMIVECKKLFTVSSSLYQQVQSQSSDQLRPVPFQDIANSPLQIRAFGQERIQMVLKEAHDKNRGWVPVLADSDVEISCRKPLDDCPLKEWKLVADIEAPPIEVLHRIMHERHAWDEDLLNWSVVEKLGPHSDVFQFVLNSMAPHPCRHFCVLRYWRSDLNKGACALITMSVDHLDAMEVTGVPATDLGSYFLVEPCGSGRSRLTYITRMDTRGRAPEWYTRIFGHFCAGFLDRLRESFKQVPSGPETRV